MKNQGCWAAVFLLLLASTEGTYGSAFNFSSSSSSLVVPVPVLSWNVHWQCGSDHVKGCREAATTRVAELVQATKAEVVVIVELEVDSATPISLPLPGWTQVNGSCPGAPGLTGDAIALAVSPTWSVVSSGGGCLGGSTAGNFKKDARAFAVALTNPPQSVQSCPDGLCLVGLHSPHINITEGGAVVDSVCGAVKLECLVAAGDWNAPVAPSPSYNVIVEDRWIHLFGNRSGLPVVAVPDVNTCCYPETKYLGIDDHVVTNVKGASVDGLTVFPYQMKLSNDTEEHKPVFVNLLLPRA